MSQQQLLCTHTGWLLGGCESSYKRLLVKFQFAHEMGNTPILQMGMLKHTALDKSGQLQYKTGGRLSFLVLATTLANKNKIKAIKVHLRCCWLLLCKRRSQNNFSENKHRYPYKQNFPETSYWWIKLHQVQFARQSIVFLMAEPREGHYTKF